MFVVRDVDYRCGSTVLDTLSVLTFAYASCISACDNAANGGVDHAHRQIRRSHRELPASVATSRLMRAGS